jgi:hypothetical protein
LTVATAISDLTQPEAQRCVVVMTEYRNGGIEMGRGKRFAVSSALFIGGCSLLALLCAAARAQNADILTGKWEWQATCDRGEFHGVMELIQQGGTFTGQFLETNFWDKGTISNGVLRGNNMSFDRTYGLIAQHLSADLSDSNRRLAGPYDSTMFGKCVLRGKKL